MMKKIFLALLLCTLFIGGFFMYILYQWNKYEVLSDNVAIRVNESTDSYQIYASYNRSKARRLQNYLDAKLNTHHMFNSPIDASFTLNDRTHIYVRNIPGRLIIRLNKNENNAESYYRIKRLGEEIKLRLTEN